MKMNARKLILAGVMALFCAVMSAQEVENRLVDAVALYNAGSYGEGASLLNTLSKADPSNDAVWYYLGLCEAMQGDVDAAVNHLKRRWNWTPAISGTGSGWRPCTSPRVRTTW